jgi:hypothetical protein
MIYNELAKTAYEAYRAHTGGKSLATGQEIPAWENLAPVIQDAWKASVKAVHEKIMAEGVPFGEEGSA